ncbi:hypothetical protein DL89DRAFT_299636 [Linderina pennispora]|uniref:F-box domain-containing protein n=1 Tax=Linderina pennispora TaxID=61395 RepID=A0A1Y1WK88_9FUNG|nr:uncharacterized protein DL89DRAFT_299636 [Linderina pennispora]ORX74000.1 hypothetical protein DL89DRAFT_299636 [Linderina pennispora]
MQPAIQHPPLLILERILFYLSPEFPLEWRDKEDAYEIVKPITHVCQSWQHISLCHKFQHVYVGTQTRPALRLAHTLNVCDKIKGVTIILQTNSIFHSPGAALLKKHILNGHTLANVTNLTFIFFGSSYKVNNPLADLYSREFSDELFRIFPSITHIGVKQSWETATTDPPSYLHNLLQRLLNGRAGSTTDEYCLSDILPFPPNAAPLQSLDISSVYKSKSVYALVRKKRSILAMSTPRTDCIHDGATAMYPQLHMLHIRTSIQYQNSMLDLVSTDGVPFSALKTLVFYGLYPFEDDTLLRGSEDSLTLLDMYISNSTIDTFCQFNLLGKSLGLSYMEISALP